MLKITGEELGYPVYANNNYRVSAYVRHSGVYGIKINANGRYNVQVATIHHCCNGLASFENPEALPKYVINKVYTLAEKIKKDDNHIPLDERE